MLTAISVLYFSSQPAISLALIFTGSLEPEHLKLLLGVPTCLWGLDADSGEGSAEQDCCLLGLWDVPSLLFSRGDRARVCPLLSRKRSVRLIKEEQGGERQGQKGVKTVKQWRKGVAEANLSRVKCCSSRACRRVAPYWVCAITTSLCLQWARLNPQREIKMVPLVSFLFGLIIWGMDLFTSSFRPWIFSPSLFGIKTWDCRFRHLQPHLVLCSPTLLLCSLQSPKAPQPSASSYTLTTVCPSAPTWEGGAPHTTLKSHVNIKMCVRW